MIDLRGRGALVATGIAVGLHVLLFFGTTTAGDQSSMSRRKAPFTGYNVFPATADDVLVGVNTVRVFNSPVHFSLPSSMGFSRFLKMKSVETRTSYVQQPEAETFLEMAPAVQRIRSAEDFQKLQVLATSRPLAVPSLGTRPTGEAPVLRRFLMDDVLQHRLAADPVLSEEFNQPVEKAWEISATVQVTESGRVEHVFLEHPVESAALNQKILQFLYGLRFTPGAAIEGTIELYSPEATITEGTET
ncbi:MAG: hypothetical protein JXR40_00790 [Pontiellaceae bacterium]|nr:hypothetical protein [Pontiellaceae bacterium]